MSAPQLSPLYQYLQLLLSGGGKGLVLHLTDGGTLAVPPNSANFTQAGALVVKVDNRQRVINESSIVHVSHDGPPFDLDLP